MRNIRLTIEYDGSRYQGWARLGKNESNNSISNKIVEVLEKMTKERDIELFCGCRTEVGVHAYAQIVNFKTDCSLKCMDIKHYLNRYLPMDIAVVAIEEVDERFHARLTAKGKTYEYRIDNGKIANVFQRKFTMREENPLDLDAMRAAAVQFLGTHDFKTFCANKKMKKSTVRTITAIEIKEMDGIVSIRYTGNGFLYNMVRILTGTLIEVGRGKRKPAEMADVIHAKDRGAAGFTAPAQGLFLVEVDYAGA